MRLLRNGVWQLCCLELYVNVFTIHNGATLQYGKGVSCTCSYVPFFTRVRPSPILTFDVTQMDPASVVSKLQYIRSIILAPSHNKCLNGFVEEGIF